MKCPWPKVSVVISTYNRPEMLTEALESVAEQTYKDFDVVVADDGSNTAKDVCPKFEKAFRAIYLVDLPDNTGAQNIPKNQAIGMSRASYIAYLDDDNLWDPEHLEGLMDDIEDGSADLVYSRFRYEGDGPFTGTSTPLMKAEDYLGTLFDKPQNNFIDTSSMLHSKAAVQYRFGGTPWEESATRFGDWVFVCKCAQTGIRMRAVDRVTMTYRWHGQNLQLTREPTEAVLQVKRGAAPDSLDWAGGESIHRGGR